MDADFLDPDEQALVKKPRPVGWFVAGAVVIAALTVLAAYYLPLKSAHAKLIEEHSALAKKAAELDHWLKADRARLGTTEGNHAALQKFIDTAVATDKERRGRLDIVQTTVERELAPFLKSKLLTIQTDADEVHLSFLEKAMFGPNSSTASPGARGILCKAVGALSGSKDFTVEIVARSSTDDTKYWETATGRSQALAKILEGGCSFSADKIRAVADRSSSEGAPRIDVRLRLDREKPFLPSDAPVAAPVAAAPSP
jgi:hypothetical protein